MSDEQAALTVIGVIVVAGIALAVLLVRRSSTLHERLLRLVTTFGWEGPRRVWWSGAIRGRWRGIDVELHHMARYKGIPERILLVVKAGFPARVILKRRTGGFLSKPLTLFGPPLVEPMNFAGRDQYWIRSDQPMFVERLFSRSEVAPTLEANLIAGFDVIDLQSRQLRILRAIDDSAVKKRFNRPFIKFTRDFELIETIASEEWGLAQVIAEGLGMRGYE